MMWGPGMVSQRLFLLELDGLEHDFTDIKRRESYLQITVRSTIQSH